MNGEDQLDLISIVPWDDELGGTPSRLHDSPLFAWTTPEQVRKVRAPVRLRLDARGGLHMLGEAGGVLHLDNAGQPVGRTRLPEAGDRIVDYACDSDNDCLLLERLDGATPLNRIRRLDPDGAERWSRTGPVRGGAPDFDALAGRFSKLLLDESGPLYLTADGRPEIAEIDPNTGSVIRVLRQREGAGIPFLAAGRLHSVFFDEQTDRRGISVLSPDGARSAELDGALEHFAWLVHPFGVDDQSRVYVWRDGRVARVSIDGDVQPLAEIEGIAVRSADRSVFTSHSVADGVIVRGGGAETTLPAQPGYRLVHVDREGRYYLLGPEAAGQVVERRVYSPDGRLESSGPAPASLYESECQLPSYDAWQVDPAGRFVLPVVTPEGLAIVRSRKG